MSTAHLPRCDRGHAAALRGRTIAVVGATGAVGREALDILAASGVPASRVRAFASERSGGTTVRYGDDAIRVRALGLEAGLSLSGAGVPPVHSPSEAHGAFSGVDVALFAASADAARRWAPEAVRAGAVVIDNSSAFRMDPGVPLVIPEVNARLLDAGPSLIANPNCSTIILLTALEPLRRAFGIERVHVATYQAVSGAGMAAIDELQSQTAAALAGRPTPSRVFREPCAFNVFSHDSPVDPGDGLNVEERKIIEESAKVWARAIPVTPACVRVPVVRAHSQAVCVTLGAAAGVDEARAILAGAPGLRLIDDRAGNDFPTPLKASGGDEVLVGRVRADPAWACDDRGRSRHLCLWACADQLRKGAALNAIQTARFVMERGRQPAGAAARW